MSHNLIIGLEVSPWTEIEKLLTHDWQETKITKERFNHELENERMSLAAPHNVLFIGNNQT